MSFARIVLSFFGLGFLPKAPGTWGTAGSALAAAACLAWWPGAREDWLFLCGAWVVAASGLTVLLAPEAEAGAGVKDPQWIVTDEVAGYWLTLAAARRPDATTLVAAFFVFRFLDVVKPFPAGRLERLPGGWGVLLDDLMAGIYGAAILFALDRVIAVA